MSATDQDAIDPSLDSGLGLQQVTTTDTGHIEINQGLSSAQRTCPWAFAETQLGVPPRQVSVSQDGTIHAIRYDSNDEINLGKL